MIVNGFRILFALVAFAGLASAAPRQPQGSVRIEITSRDLAYGGKAFGEYGPFERITAVAHMRIDPANPANRHIVDLAFAPRDAAGMVAYDVDLVILRPRDGQRGRRVMLYDVVNRGAKTLSGLNGGGTAGPDPIAEGDGFLMRQGYTLVWSGWQGDVAARGMVGARFPLATRNGRPITGRVSTETIFDNADRDRINLPYAAASQAQATARLTVRQNADDRPILVPPSDWRFEDNLHVRVKRAAGMDAGAIYSFEYLARDPKVMGLGFAAVRDLIAFLRHGSAAQGNPLADLAGAPCERDARGACANSGGGAFSSAVAMGGSQSARYLRDLVWQGFNRDLVGRRVFDGMIPYIPGARQTFTNVRFAEPGRFSRQHEDHGIPGFVFPFTYATITDPVTGSRDGIMRACSADGTCPKLFHVDSSGEFWQAGASLVGTGGTNRDIAFPANVRAYMIAGGAHAARSTASTCAYPANPMLYTPLLRAFLVAMVDWTTGRREPPPSRWPSINDLQPVEAQRGPDVPGLAWAKVLNRPVSPVRGREWPVLVPRIDADGNDLPGIRMPDIVAPTGTYLGWSLRKSGFAEGELCLVYGSYVAFAKDAASRGKDSRPSLAERYPAPGQRETRFAQAIETLRQQRLLLDEDAAALAKQAAAQ